MQLDHELIGKFAGFFATLGFIPYIISVFRNKTVPSKASWTIWVLIGTALALSYKTAGANASMWVPISYAVCPAIVLVVASFKNRSKEKWPKMDRVCFQIGLALFVPWTAFKIIESLDMLPMWGWILPLITLYGGIAVDGFGAIPTIWKSWQKPGSEDFWGWACWCTGNVLNLGAVETWSWSIASYVVYMALPAVLILPPLLIHRIRNHGLSPLAAPVD